MGARSPRSCRPSHHLVPSADADADALKQEGAPMITVAAKTPTKVTVKPDPNSLPGGDQLQQLINGLAFWMLLAALASILIAAGTWGLASHMNNHQWSARGKSGVFISAASALVIGAAGAIINFSVDLGSQVK
jgi:H+/gluconate symporter-like permease